METDRDVDETTRNEADEEELDEEDEEALAWFFLCLILLLWLNYNDRTYRSSPYLRRRWQCERLRQLAEQELSFVTEYRVTPKVFDILVELLADKLQSGPQANTSCGGSVSVDSKIGISLILLGGGRCTDAMRAHGVSRSMVYVTFHAFLRTVLMCPNLQIKCDNSLAALQSRASDFEQRSSFNLFRYCTGAVDGISIHIKAPTTTHDQLRFLSGGNRRKYSINVQAAVDAKHRFLAVSAKHCGSTNDFTAFVGSCLYNFASSQELPYHWVADNAYTCTNYMMTPYYNEENNVEKEAFNYYLNQIRITVEQTFGMFINRFGIFWKPLEFKLPTCAEIIMAACSIHNLCMNNHCNNDNESGISFIPGSDPIARTYANGVLQDPSWTVTTPHYVRNSNSDSGNGASVLRNHLVEEIIDKQIRKPNHYH